MILGTVTTSNSPQGDSACDIHITRQTFISLILYQCHCKAPLYILYTVLQVNASKQPKHQSVGELVYNRQTHESLFETEVFVKLQVRWCVTQKQKWSNLTCIVSFFSANYCSLLVQRSHLSPVILHPDQDAF